MKEWMNDLFKDESDKALDIQFEDSDVKDICKKLDHLIALANKSISEDETDLESISAKIRSGIMRLELLSQYELMVFYQKELDLIQKRKNNKIYLLVIIGILVFGYLIFIAFFA
jgi:hypothetical protein